ncbi:hypothetical protein [Aeromicrobium sp.]|uniref:hypothetical protein n=1 Tax=Aeromicrobium sp. TaxID=1871063 RepID=UPI00198F35E4|nr:hypothetical protein [Aeromicrobium sp.]MBC7632340.1 hypothetical protein [Aeromicrobium sp.]
MPSSAACVRARVAAGPVRVARSVAAALVCTATATSGHMAGGGTVSGPALVAMFIGATAVAWLLSARRVTSGQLVGLLMLCQVVLHLGCSTTDMSMSVSMLLMHLTATAASAALLARGETLVWAVARRLGLTASPLWVQADGVAVCCLPSPLLVTRTLRDTRLTYVRVERGPPNGS